ncbi:Nn.00g077970.m01.CDS01 [Neocucurbitaria sp. VM-36]
MHIYVEDAFIKEAEAQAAALIASSDAVLKKCEKKAEDVENKLKKVDAHLEMSEGHLAEMKAMNICPSLYSAAKKLPEAEFQLRYVHYKLAEEVKEKERLQVKYHNTSLLERRTKKENKV